MLLTDLFKLVSGIKKPRVGWLLLGDIATGSSRIHGINIHNYLLRNGIASVICQSSPTMNRHLALSAEEQEALLLSGINIFVFQKVFDEQAVAFARRARAKGIKTVFLLSDKHDTEMVGAVDQLVVTSAFLKEHFDKSCGTNAVMIEDAIEVPAGLYKEHRDKETLQLIWVGHSDNWQTVEIIREVLAKIGDGVFSLKTISNHLEADVRWELDTVFNEILAGDIGVIPALDNEWGKSKSNNRLTMFMALGLPVVASAVPSYRKIVNKGVNGFLPENGEQWLECLAILKDKEVRARIGARARQDAISQYGIDVIGKEWVALFYQLLTAQFYKK